MDQDTLDRFSALLDEREKVIFNATNPKEAAIQYLIEIGYLDLDGNIAERFREMLPENDKITSSAKRVAKIST